MVRAVLFDADGVVQHTPPEWLRRLQDELNGEDALCAVFEAERPTLIGVGEFRASVASVLADFNRTERLERVLAYWREIEVDRDVLARVDELRADGIRCYLATNQQAIRASYMRNSLGYDERFDDQFYSCELGVAKPDPAYFEVILERLGLPPDEVLFVDDSAANVEAAVALGLRTQLYAAGQPILAER